MDEISRETCEAIDDHATLGRDPGPGGGRFPLLSLALFLPRPVPRPQSQIGRLRATEVRSASPPFTAMHRGRD